MKLSTRDFKEFVRHPYAWPGGYPLYAILSDGECLCKTCARTEAKHVIRAMRAGDGSGWRAIAVDINWEDPDLTCAHCNAPIESAYGES